MLRGICIAATAAFMAFASVTAEAKDIPSAGVTYDDVVAWLQAKGMDAKITQDGAGHKIVQTSVSGVKFDVYFFDCQGERCGSIQFAAGWPRGKILATKLNDWNRLRRWARAYFDQSEGIWLESDVDLTPGGSYELLDDNYATWKKTVENFKEFFSIQ